MKAGSSSFEKKMADEITIDTQFLNYNFEHEASSDEEFDPQTSPESTNEERLKNNDSYVFKNHLLCTYAAYLY